MQVFDPYPRWRKPKRSDSPDDWPDGSSAIRVRTVTLTPEQAIVLERLAGVVLEVPKRWRTATGFRRQLALELTRHRNLWARAYLMEFFLEVGATEIARRLEITRQEAWRAIRSGPDILREYFSEEELRGLLECWGSPRPP